MLLQDDRNLFSDLIKETSDYFSILPNYVEKEYYALSTLKNLIKENEHFVFKGGTSLSVCYNVINRFSEDIDISYEKEYITTGKRKEIKRQFINAINETKLYLENEDDIRSRRLFNRYICRYESISGEQDRIYAEWASQTPSFPIVIKSAQTLIAKYLMHMDRNDVISKYNLEPFNVKTVTLERTFIDKIFAICDYYLVESVDRHSRHLYDLYCLFDSIRLDDDFLSLFIKVKKYRSMLDISPSSNNEVKISEVLSEIISKNYFYNDYLNKTNPLLYVNTSYQDCLNVIVKIRNFLVEREM